MKLSDYVAAGIYLEQALVLDESNLETFQQLGLCHFALKDHAQALARFRQGLALSPEDLTCLQGVTKCEI